MYKFTLTLILNPEQNRVLMCHHKKFGKLNFIGGKINANESVLEATYRELFEETGIRRTDTHGIFVFRHEVVELFRPDKYISGPYPDFDMYVSMGVLKHDVELKEEKNPLEWVDIYDTPRFLSANGDGINYVFLKEGLDIIKTFGDRWPIV